MEALKEITVWQGCERQPNHVYLMDGNKALAYIKFGEGEPFYFKNGLTLDKRGRKFEVVKPNPFKETRKSNAIAVSGSKGQVYYVDPEAKTCTCAGFQFRGQCRHLAENS